MKVICISNNFHSIQFGDFLTIGKIYNVIIDSFDKTPSLKRVFMIMCDDNATRSFPEEVLMTIDKWRENQLNKIGIHC